MNKRTFFLASASALGLLTQAIVTQARAAEFGSLGLVNFNRVEADFNVNRSAALLANVGVDSIGVGYKYFLDRNHAGFNLAARGNLGLNNTNRTTFSGTLGYRFLIPTANSGIRGLELEAEGGPAVFNINGNSSVETTLALRAGIRF
jgi:hypothetical protein